ncbi:MAG TPA: GIY-YIG nuclease family protein [Rhodopila sp.]|nr:GIY-YIG nuclease family protein [Rhodopila sp.]
MMSNRPNGTLYLGVTSDLVRRVWEHRNGQGSRLVQRYYLKRLVWFEQYEDITTAIQRETSLKRWPREWKVALIEKENSGWDDLYPRLI